MMFVLDCSMARAFVLRDESTEDTEALLDSLGQGSSAVVPAFWRWEVANVLLMAQRGGRVSPTDAHPLSVGHGRHMAQLKGLPFEMDETACEESWSAAFALAQKYSLSSYDATYLEAAIRRGIPLTSLDRELRTVAKVEKIQLLPEKL